KSLLFETFLFLKTELALVECRYFEISFLPQGLQSDGRCHFLDTPHSNSLGFWQDPSRHLGAPKHLRDWHHLQKTSHHILQWQLPFQLHSWPSQSESNPPDHQIRAQEYGGLPPFEE